MKREIWYKEKNHFLKRMKKTRKKDKQKKTYLLKI